MAAIFDLKHKIQNLNESILLLFEIIVELYGEDNENGRLIAVVECAHAPI